MIIDDESKDIAELTFDMISMIPNKGVICGYICIGGMALVDGVVTSVLRSIVSAGGGHGCFVWGYAVGSAIRCVAGGYECSAEEGMLTNEWFRCVSCTQCAKNDNSKDLTSTDKML